ncbi:hypothetical protein ACYOEI_26755 [Singulisphaera rosea]
MITSSISVMPKAVSRVIRLAFEGGVCVLAGTMLWWIAAQVGPSSATVTVHVTDPNVTVEVGDVTFKVGSNTYTPFVCELPNGEHRITMRRGNKVLYTDSFKVEDGEDRVLTTWQITAPVDMAQAELASHEEFRPNRSMPLPR